MTTFLTSVLDGSIVSIDAAHIIEISVHPFYEDESRIGVFARTFSGTDFRLFESAHFPAAAEIHQQIVEGLLILDDGDGGNLTVEDGKVALVGAYSIRRERRHNSNLPSSMHATERQP